MYYDPEFNEPGYTDYNGVRYRNYAGTQNPGVDPDTRSSLGQRGRTEMRKFYEEHKMGVFSDERRKLNTDLLSSIGREYIPRSTPAAPATKHAKEFSRRIFQIACKNLEIEERYKEKAHYRKERLLYPPTRGIDLFFSEDTVIPPGTGFVLPVGIACRLLPAKEEDRKASIPWMICPKEEMLSLIHI